tara:strand:- start:181 stop:414 length:234 start_codon:yes stop_codon:yes gene_type:complete
LTITARGRRVALGLVALGLVALLVALGLVALQLAEARVKVAMARLERLYACVELAPPHSKGSKAILEAEQAPFNRCV